jgi:glycine oxidase
VASQSITVVGAGIIGLWQALTLLRRGHRVRLLDAAAEPFASAASRLAGAMLAPDCEGETAEPCIEELGRRAMVLWRDTFPGIVNNGTLVVAAARDRSELQRFSRVTKGHEAVDADRIAALEPDLAGRFASGLFYGTEAHMAPLDAMHFLLAQLRKEGADVRFSMTWDDAKANADTNADVVIDCRGLMAQDALPELRGVRGERMLLHTNEVRLTRPVRLLHPRQPLYVVPWGDGVYMVGATVIESSDPGRVTVRSALELLGLAYALSPAFGEAEIVELDAGVRPSFPDNVPRILVRDRTIYVNGLYRHGFLVAPALAELVAEYLQTGATRADIFGDPMPGPLHDQLAQ